MSNIDPALIAAHGPVQNYAEQHADIQFPAGFTPTPGAESSYQAPANNEFQQVVNNFGPSESVNTETPDYISSPAADAMANLGLQVETLAVDPTAPTEEQERHNKVVTEALTKAALTSEDLTYNAMVHYIHTLPAYEAEQVARQNQMAAEYAASDDADDERLVRA